MSPAFEPYNPPLLAPLKQPATEEQTVDYNTKKAEWDIKKAAYNKVIPTWNEKQARTCMAVRSKCRYNNYQKIKDFKRVFSMLDILRAGREAGSRKLMELTTRFYSLHLAKYESISDFSGQLSQINNELQDLHPTTAFSQIQLVLRFL